MRFPFARLAAAALLLASWGRAASLGLQPYLQNVGEDRASILWTTVDGPGRGEVRFSTGGASERAVPSQARLYARAETELPYEFWLHRVDLTGLTAQTLYRYRVYLDGALVTPAATPQGELRFTTAGNAPLRFLAFGDSGDGAPVQLDLMRRLAAENPAFVLHAGDLAYEDGTFLQLHEFFFRVYQSLASRFPIIPVPGNHDYQFRAAAAYLAMFAPPETGVPPEGRGRYYSFDWGPVHVTALDSNRPLLDASAGTGPMLRWLEQDLQSTDRQWRVALFHHTPLPNTHHVGDPNCQTALDLIAPVLERHGVHLALSGHEHLYQRSVPRQHTVYVTTGGGGYALHPAQPRSYAAVAVSVPHYLRVDVSGNTMQVQAISEQGEVVDTFTLSSAAELTANGIVNAAAFTPELAPGGLFTLLGKDLVRAGATVNAPPLATSSSGLRLLLGGQSVPLLYVSRNQINAQLPFGVTGGVTLELEGPNGAVARPLAISETAPAVFMVPHGTLRLPAVIHTDGRLVTPEAPALAGEAVSIYLTGLGAVSPILPAGLAAPTGILHRAVSAVSVTAGGLAAEVLFAGLSPGLVGVNQINFVVPRVAVGTSPVMFSVSAGTVATPPLALHVR